MPMGLTQSEGHGQDELLLANANVRTRGFFCVLGSPLGHYLGR